MFREYTEQKDHGFLMIAADKKYEEKFFYGKADMLDISPEHILGCKEFWKGSDKQLTQICDGRMAAKMEKLRALGFPDEEPEEEEDTAEDYVQEFKKRRLT